MSKKAVEKKRSQKRSQFAFNKLHVNEDNAQLDERVISSKFRIGHFASEVSLLNTPVGRAIKRLKYKKKRDV